MKYYLALALALPIFLIGVQNVWAPSNEPTFYGFSHFKNLPVLHPGETKQFEIKIENAHGSTLYGLDPQISIYPKESNSFIDIHTDFVSELKNGQIGTIHVTITADENLPIKDLQITVYFTANDEKENVLTGAWNEPVDNTIVVQPPQLLSQKILAPLKQFKSGIPTDKIEFIDGKPFFVSEKYNATRDPSKIIMFHGVAFTHPVFPDPPAPGGGAFTDITFSDGTEETLSQVGLLKYPVLLTKHVNPQAGMRENQYDTFSILVSADMTKISPLQQFRSGIPINEIQCTEGLQLMERSNGMPLCVKQSSIVPLMLRDLIKVVGFEITSGFFEHTIENGQIVSMRVEPQECGFIQLQIQTQNDGGMIVSIPKKIFDLKTTDRMDLGLMVLIDGQEVAYEESGNKSQRILIFKFDKDSKTIEIAKTCLI